MQKLYRNHECTTKALRAAGIVIAFAHWVTRSPVDSGMVKTQ